MMINQVIKIKIPAVNSRLQIFQPKIRKKKAKSDIIIVNQKEQ